MRHRLPLSLRLYRLASKVAVPTVAPRWLSRRQKRGKESAARIAERYGRASLPRPDGPLIWLHCASVGEMLAVVPLAANLRARNFAVLLTSGTVTSAALAERRLPEGALHQFIPLDAPRFIGRFLEHWQPDLALFVESDLWPNLILGCDNRGIPMILINGRISERSFGRWQMLPRLIGALLERFDLCLTQSDGDAQRYGALGAAHVTSVGNLKLDVPPPPADPATLQTLKSAIGTRAVLAAASTHAGEENEIINAHRRLRAKYPSLLTVIVPRHPDRGPAIAEAVRLAGLAVALRSRGDLPKSDVGVYVFDTMGELGLVYRLAPIVFMGGSLTSHGGQNPIEAVRLGAAVVHGPHVWNFAEIYKQLDFARGATLVTDEAALVECVSRWLADPGARKAAADAAAAAVAKLGGALDRTLAAIEPYLMQLQLQQRAS